MSFSPLAELLPERTAPELRYLQSKWASLVSYGLTVDLLEEVLPIQTNVATVFLNLHQVAERLEGELGEEQFMFVEGCPAETGQSCPGQTAADRRHRWRLCPRPGG